MSKDGRWITLDELADASEGSDAGIPAAIKGLTLADTPPPAAIANLRKLAKLGILNFDTILGLVAQAPIDPINLAGTLMQMTPGEWAFSAVDFSMFHVLAKGAKGKPIAALRVDLIAGDSIMALVCNKANQLVEFRTLKVEPGPGTLDSIQALCAEAILAARREAS